MPAVGDELHRYGWNACSSACNSDLTRDTLVVPGIRSSRIHIVDVSDRRRPQIKSWESGSCCQRISSRASSA